MDINILKKTQHKLKFDIKDVNTAFINALRRITMMEVPVLAIEDVVFEANNSVLYDELVAQRLGQVPLKFDPEDFNFRDECECGGEGCPNCEAVILLEKSGSGTVYSGDLKIAAEGVEVLHDNIPILKLEENHKIKLEATAILGRGKEHSKWQAAISSYKNYPIIDVDNEELEKDETKEIADTCPKDVFEINNGKLEVAHLEKCDLCKECIEKTDIEAVSIESNDSRFIFKLESISGLEPKTILKRAMEVLEEKSGEVLEKID